MSKIVKKYIDQEDWIRRLQEELETTTNEKRKTYLNILINSILCQPIINIEIEEQCRGGVNG